MKLSQTVVNQPRWSLGRSTDVSHREHPAPGRTASGQATLHLPNPGVYRDRPPLHPHAVCKWTAGLLPNYFNLHITGISTTMGHQFEPLKNDLLLRAAWGVYYYGFEVYEWLN